MRKFLTILIVFSFAVQLFNGNMLMLNYAIDNQSFLKNCENISRPILQCEGKCQLQKQIAEAEEKQQQNPDSRSEIKIDFFVFSYKFSTLTIPAIVLSHCQFPIDASLRAGSIAEIFQPPAVC